MTEQQRDLTIDEVSAELRIHRKTVERFIQQGLLRAYMVNRRHYRITREALDDYKRQNEVKGEPVEVWG